MHLSVSERLLRVFRGTALAVAFALTLLFVAAPPGFAQAGSLQGTWTGTRNTTGGGGGLPATSLQTIALYQTSGSTSVTGTIATYWPTTTYYWSGTVSGTLSGSTLTLTWTPTVVNLPSGASACSDTEPLTIATSGGVTTATVPTYHPCGSGTVTINSYALTGVGWQHIGCSPCGPGAQSGLLVDVATGNATYSETDYTTAGMNPLALVRTYNSLLAQMSYATLLGVGWRTNFDRYLIFPSSTQVIAERPSGDEITFTLVGSTWTPPPDVDMTLTSSGSTWTLTAHDDTVETYTAVTHTINGVLFGTKAGQLNTIKLRNGYTQTMAYNSSYQLTSVTDSYSRSLNFTFTGSLITQATTPDTLTLTYGYNGAGTLLETVTYNTSPTTSKTYNYANASFPTVLTSVVDENGNTFQTFSYDTYGRGATSQSGTGPTLTFTFNDTAATRTVENPLTQNDTYALSLVGGYSKVVSLNRAANGTVTTASLSFAHDSNGYISQTTDWSSINTAYTNNSHGDPTTIVEDSGGTNQRTTTIVYDTTWVHLPHSITTPGVTATFTYDGSGNPLTVTLTDTTTTSTPYSTNGQTRVWTYTYDATGHVKTAKTPNGNTTTFTWDSSGTLTNVQNALLQNVQVTSHTNGGRPLTIVDPNSVTTTLTYSPRNWLLTTDVDSTGGAYTTTNTYDAAGNLTKIQKPDGSYITQGFDNAHRLTSIADSFSNNIAYTLDGLGNQTATTVTNPSSTVTLSRSATFDSLGRQLTDVGGMSQTTTYTWGSRGNISTIKDALSNTTTTTFDDLNRLKTHVDPSPGGTTSYTYDAHDRVLTYTYPNSGVVSFVYDGFGDLIQETSPDRGTWVYYYDSDGNLTKRVDGTSHTMNATYDALDRPATNSYPSDASENVTFTYDQTGTGFTNGIDRLTTVADAAGTLTRTYDTRGNLTSEKRVNGTTTLTTSYTYDAASRVASITYPDNALVTYTRDAMGKVTSMSLTPSGGSPQSVVSSVAYEPFGPVTGFTFGNSVTDAKTYDNDYRLLTIADTGTSTTPLSLTYTWNAVNNPTKIADNVASGNTQNLTYDALLHVSTASGNYGSLGWTWGLNANPSAQTGSAITFNYTANTNKLSSFVIGSTTTSLSYTGGNVTTFSPAYNGVTGFTFNQNNRMASASNGSTVLANYTYDAFGKRLSKNYLGLITTLYQYGPGGALLEETNSTQTIDYIYLNGVPIAFFYPSGPALYYLHTDGLGTPRNATNSLQSSVWGTTYQPFGLTGTITGTATQNLRYPGQYYDGETQLYHNGFRDYAPQLGRYLESDPIGTNAGFNTFLYANANPITNADPMGLSIPQPYQPHGKTPDTMNPQAGAVWRCGEGWGPGNSLPFHEYGGWSTLGDWKPVTDYGVWTGKTPDGCNDHKTAETEATENTAGGPGAVISTGWCFLIFCGGTSRTHPFSGESNDYGFVGFGVPPGPTATALASPDPDSFANGWSVTFAPPGIDAFGWSFGSAQPYAAGFQPTVKPNFTLTYGFPLPQSPSDNSPNPYLCGKLGQCQ